MQVRFPGAAQHDKSAFTRVFDALWRSGALQTRDRRNAGLDPAIHAQKQRSILQHAEIQ